LKKTIFALLLVLLSSNRCAEKITSISFINKTIVVLSKNEYVDYNNNFLSIGFVMDRTVNQNDKREIGLEAYELNNFKNEKNDYVFDIYDKINIKKIDSIIIKKENLKLFRSNFVIYE